ncbi:ribonuclease R [Reyranella sp.]|jgi:ribonuclease R|uniref:ribonuclease R n=1 Tax=Reyranella sp. TaxID=1929291 RepID=UPI000BC5906D|nr:ribonuclease R [Reyranella sp.]OYY46111.1 MAG: ribonuclease R [Rhodospirillales bacterium 35-66-84]OYZ96491.1 MAG: ribonuclease R [Rhodospirillales bacterium 24-66-33]OZB28345.1 MAG: ribonuclease R [Rhodospirillales bacterium 39-66-50]HQS14451.1 ribonuclease R [Reyranella sp.]HQT11448.1 ribonuclease R [Reyranella sp.]
MAKGKVPARDELLAFIRDSETPVGKREIARAYGLKGDQRIELKELLRDLRDAGEITPDRAKTFRHPESLSDMVVLEIVSVDDDGHLLAVPRRHDDDKDGPPPRIEVTAPASRTVPAPAVGDRVLASMKRRGKNTYEAKVVRRLGSGPKKILGLYEEPPGRNGLGLVTPTDRKLRREFDVRPSDRNGALPGDIVWIEEIGGALARRARVVERIGPMSDPRTVSLISIAANDIPVDFPEAAIEEADKAKAAPMGHRLDLRDVPLVTIDGEDARDFDDAVFAEPDPGHAGGWRILVAIADVAWYVRHDRPLDRAAYRRGTSVYFPDRVVPMLPEQLSNHWCSLVPHEDRPVLVAEMWIDGEGHLKRHKFHRAMMRSAARLTYNRVQRAMNGTPDAEIEPLMDEVVRPLYGAFRVLLAAREARGALDLDLPERQVTLGKDGHIATIGVRERLDSHKLIEEFMVLANVAAAQALEQRQASCLYRVHDQPDLAKLEALREFLGTLGIKVPTGQRLRPADLNRVLHEVADKPVSQLVSQTVLRSQSQAVYSPDNLGHFGLALARYAHFTSPIRRFPDLIVHRALIAAYGLGEGGLSSEDKGRFTEFGEHLSMCERRAVAAERGAMDRYVAAFMAGHVGAVFPGRVNGVTRFGLFATLEGTGADGLIPIRSLGQEFFRHDEGRQVLIGERTGETFGLGDRLQIKLVEADMATGGLLFEIVDVIERVERQPAPRSFRSEHGKERSGPPRRPVAHRGPPRDKGSRRRK